jgi:hypothetical protein
MKKPELHKNYSYEQAIASFGDVSSREEMCDGQFIVLPRDVLCLATVGNPANEPHFCSPSEFIWKPQRLDYVPSDDKFPWLPEAVREVWHSESRKKMKAHHIFVRANDKEHFFYAGTAHLGGYGSSLEGNGMEANFSLYEKLPREIWLRLGGYPGWLVDINHTTHRINKGDLTIFNTLLEQLFQQEFSHLSMTRYEEDSLHVHTNNRRGWLMYLRESGDYGVYVKDSKYAGDPKVEEVFRCTCGISLEFPINQTVSLEDAIRVAREFFITGQLPDCIPWELD